MNYRDAASRNFCGSHSREMQSAYLKLRLLVDGRMMRNKWKFFSRYLYRSTVRPPDIFLLFPLAAGEICFLVEVSPVTSREHVRSDAIRFSNLLFGYSSGSSAASLPIRRRRSSFIVVEIARRNCSRGTSFLERRIAK